jgi:RHS repeat-associated protein
MLVVSEAGNAEGRKLQWLVHDQLGTPRMIFDTSGKLHDDPATTSIVEGVRRHDYLPFGEENVYNAAGGSRTAASGHVADGVRQKFGSNERDNETGLDFIQARYYGSVQGRFTNPDDFWKDSHVSDPQSWNKYAYVRNNPLKYIDPTGERATVTIETDEEKKKGIIKITASIALWTGDKNISKEALNKAAADIKKSIEGAWKGEYEQGGIKFDVSAEITVTVQGSEAEAAKSGAQNVLEIFNDKPGEASNVSGRSLLQTGADTGRWGINGVSVGLGAHEFTHLLGVNNHNDGAYLSNTNYIPGRTATASDYGWAFGGAINSQRNGSRPWLRDPTAELGKGPQFVRGAPRSTASTRVLQAPGRFGAWR